MLPLCHENAMLLNTLKLHVKHTSETNRDNSRGMMLRAWYVDQLTVLNHMEGKDIWLYVWKPFMISIPLTPVEMLILLAKLGNVRWIVIGQAWSWVPDSLDIVNVVSKEWVCKLWVATFFSSMFSFHPNGSFSSGLIIQDILRYHWITWGLELNSYWQFWLSSHLHQVPKQKSCCWVILTALAASECTV